MADNDAPDLSSAYAGISSSITTHSSWNPALRPDHDEPRTTAHPAKSPVVDAPTGAPTDTPTHAQFSVDEAVEDSELIAPPTAAEQQVDSSHFEVDPSSAEDFFDRHDSEDNFEHASQQTSAGPPAHGDNGGEIGGLANGLESRPTQRPREDTHVSPGTSRPSPEDNSHTRQALEGHAAEKYEHQGEGTLLEEAVVDDAKAPLVPDTESATDEWEASGEVFDLGGTAQDAHPSSSEEHPLPKATAEAAGTTVGDQVIGNTTVGGNIGEEIDWGDTGDSDLFGTQASTMQGGNVSTADASAWDLALDDDFLPDNEDGTAPFDLDEDGFLEDEPVEQTAHSQSPSNRYAPQAVQTPATQPAPSPYTPPAPQFTDFSQLNQKQPIATPNVPYGGYGQPTPYQPPPPRPAQQTSAESFVDKSKGGYHSPYDLPEDVVTTRKRPAARPTPSPYGQPTQPPSRSASNVYTAPATAAVRPPPPMGAPSLTPPSSSQSNMASMTGMPPPPKPAPAKSPSSDFFAELPVTIKPKPSGRHTPQSAPLQQPPPPHGPPQHLQKERTSSWSSLRNEVFPDGHNVPPLRQPERLPVFPDQPSVPVRSNTFPIPPPASTTVPSRYSPQPPTAPAASTAINRYSPAPAPTGAGARYSPAPSPAQTQMHNRYASEPSPGLPRTSAQPYAPRTSSPLAHHTQLRSHEEPSHVPHLADHRGPEQHQAAPTDNVSGLPYRTSLEGVREIDEETQAVSQPSAPAVSARSETPPMRSGPASVVDSPRKTLTYTPHYQPTTSHGMGAGVAATGHSLSQSPESITKHTAHRHLSLDHGADVYGVPPTQGFGAPLASQRNINVIPHRRQISHDFAYIPPQDERSADPLERWKGYPIFKWGLGGTAVTSFPKQIPRYGGGASQPMLKCSPGEVKLQSMKDTLPLSEEVVKFPGPLKTKNKKKDVSAWLGKHIESLEVQLRAPGFEHSLSPDTFKRFQEKILLWKVLQILVDNDGHLEGNAAVDAAVRKVLAPEGIDSTSKLTTSVPTAADLVGEISRSTPSGFHSDPVDPTSVGDLRGLLTKGEREKAVWHAVDHRLWGHAMLLSSTLDKDIWKQVVQEFVRKEVKKAGPDNQALAVLYEIFAGNWEDCVDELVPASARAGFQMVSADGAGPTQNALQGLEKWQETLSLILNNRSNGDSAALLSLGRLLAGYGRIEAAHICFLFARHVAYVGGVDDAQSDMVLVGADHRAHPLSLGIEMEPILLTEVYEFALSLAAPSGSHIIPHLQNYKLARALTLAEYGYKSEAQAYCDAIAAAMKATTRMSPYYNGTFIAGLDDLNKRLSQSPKDGSSWISKPSMDKVSSSLLSKFNSFIAGEDDDVASNNSAEVGPFARIAGNTPTLSPSHSSADLYGAYSSSGGASAPPSLPANSRYAPRASLDKSATAYEPQGRPSTESQSSNPYIPSPALSGPYTPQSQFSPTSVRPEPSKAQSYAPLKAPGASSSHNPYQPTAPPGEHNTPFSGYQPPQESFDSAPSHESTQSSNSYEPPAMGGYEPPSYEPYNPGDEDKADDEAEPRKKKSFMDDDSDDDLIARAAALKSKQKSEADRLADEAFRKAAEADAQKDKETANNKKSGGGWFGSWFKKDPNASPGPIKAKLGEENSFYYDPDLKKWVNKKAGVTETAKTATPPPPKSGPPSRSVSDVGGPSAPPSSGASSAGPPSAPPFRPPTSNPQRSSSMPPPMGGFGAPGSRTSTPGVPSGDEGGAGGKAPPPLTRPPLVPGQGNGPHSRPSTGMSNASSIDDLLGAPGPKKGGRALKKKGSSRYVDVMAQK
ncbi:uncharacterized protein EI97DRAFT_430204 [Westerdykella ornata]|uniref:Protein transport protein sec16 n=1 Tax=Westerdykella ornata TaxID=318751 RepID=A0A6A6JW91_WESOR|nr:uncharacterized protein EI97DRAFT_430204 [Westerdykella ornata]KAF2280495.1 hypothetical protein EI97DRAFT_430204 [Westerdykella ornata]